MGTNELKLLKQLLRKFHRIYGRHAIAGLQNAAMDAEMRRQLAAARL